MKTRTQLFATQGGGVAQIIGAHAYFVDDLDVPGAYRFNAGNKVPDQWDLVPLRDVNDLKPFEQAVADQKAEADMNETIRDYRPEVTSLLNRILAAGWTIVSTDDNGDIQPFTTVEAATDHITSVDEGYINLRRPDGKYIWVFIVFGNSPGELICDYSTPAGETFDSISRAHCEEWEGKDQPTTTWAERFPNIKSLS